MICCREFVKAVKDNMFGFDLDQTGNAYLEMNRSIVLGKGPVIRHQYKMAYCPFCGAKLDMDYKTPQGPFEPDMEEIFHPGGVARPSDHSIVINQEPGSGPHTTV